MNRRYVLTTLGATVLSASVLLGGTASSFAQDAATQPSTEQVASQDERATSEAERARAYDEFVSALAGELGNDEAAVDAAIRIALSQSVDAKLAAGEIDEERAAAAKAVIQGSDAPLLAGYGGSGGPGGFPGRPGRGHDGHALGEGYGEKRLPRLDEDQSTSVLPSAPGAEIAGDEDANAEAPAAEVVTS